jgi:hypothetical protein
MFSCGQRFQGLKPRFEAPEVIEGGTARQQRALSCWDLVFVESFWDAKVWSQVQRMAPHGVNQVHLTGAFAALSDGDLFS